jgi:hypothetical protein
MVRGKAAANIALPNAGYTTSTQLLEFYLTLVNAVEL